MMATTARKLYRSRNGKIFGVCQGLADWKDLEVGYIRLFMILAFLVTGFFPVGILYFIAALVLPLEPPGYGESLFEGRGEGRRDRYEDIRRDFGDLKDKVKNMEQRVFDKERDWEERFRKGK